MAKKKGLGRGLDALLPDMPNFEMVNTDQKNSIVEIDINLIYPDKNQPRKHFDKDSLDELATSIKENGVLQPITVEADKDDDGHYMIVAGERRWRASRIAGIKTIPCILREFDEQQRVITSVIENVLREDLNVIEEANAYKRLMDDFDLTQEDLSKLIGKNRSSISNAVRILTLAPEVQELLSQNLISSGHAKVLLQLEDKEVQYIYAQRCVDAELSVRDIEELVNRYFARKNVEENSEEKIDAHEESQLLDQYALAIKDIQKNLSEFFACKVKLQSTGKRRKKGKIILEYQDDEDLNRILDLMNVLD
ncbi:MAG: ParB/RepB/Spo0J family partition protein [Eubacteriales bacterium]|nr:ParB/RepB/Spo0J family partition protein [Eubacteriales bacterium]